MSQNDNFLIKIYKIFNCHKVVTLCKKRWLNHIFLKSKMSICCVKSELNLTASKLLIYRSILRNQNLEHNKIITKINSSL